MWSDYRLTDETTTSLFQRDSRTLTQKHNNLHTIAASCDVLRPHFSQPHTVLGASQFTSGEFPAMANHRNSWQHFTCNFSQTDMMTLIPIGNSSSNNGVFFESQRSNHSHNNGQVIPRQLHIGFLSVYHRHHQRPPKVSENLKCNQLFLPKKSVKHFRVYLYFSCSSTV